MQTYSKPNSYTSIPLFEMLIPQVSFFFLILPIRVKYYFDYLFVYCILAFMFT